MLHHPSLLRRSALVAAPLALAALATAVTRPSIALEQPAARPVFERVQFADVIEAVRPAVVQIAVTKELRDTAAMMPGRGGPFEEFMRRFGIPVPQGPQGGAPRAEGMGSGFIIDGDGYIVTNNHVIDGATEMTVRLHDGSTLPATLVGSDPLTDLALIKVEADDLPAVEFGDSDSARVGDWVVAIGSPFGFGGSATAGIISARGRDIRHGPYDDYLQVDAPINSGNSGGPIVDASGRVIGVNTAIYSPTGGNVGIGFAIPAREAARIVADLKTRGSVTRGWLGVQIQPVSEDVATALGLGEAAGALVAQVVDDGPAARAGLRAGDVVTRFGDTAIDEPRDLSRAVAATDPGSKVRIALSRRGRAEHVTAVLDRYPTEQRVAQAPAATNGDVADTLGLGLALGELSSSERRRRDLDADVDGALVLGIKSGSAAESSGIRPGDVIVQVNQASVASADEAAAALADAKRAERPAALLIRRGDEQFFTTLKPA